MNLVKRMRKRDKETQSTERLEKGGKETRGTETKEMRQRNKN
jgi:hypothetical protein